MDKNTAAIDDAITRARREIELLSEYRTRLVAEIRERFGIEKKNRSMASRLIRDAVEAGLIVANVPDAPPKQMKYVPFWASLRRVVDLT